VTARRTELLGLLTSYSPAAADEQGYRMEMLDLAAAALDPFDRYSYQPGHFTSSGFVVHPDGGSLLLIHHAKVGAWLQPGGHIDPSDHHLIDAARREIEEETAVGSLIPVAVGLVDIDLHVFPAHGEQPEHRHYDIRFGFVAGDDGFAHNDEATDARWFTLDEIRHLALDRSVLRPAEKLLGA